MHTVNERAPLTSFRNTASDYTDLYLGLPNGGQYSQLEPTRSTNLAWPRPLPSILFSSDSGAHPTSCYGGLRMCVRGSLMQAYVRNCRATRARLGLHLGPVAGYCCAV
jgi:hypothetical protein